MNLPMFSDMLHVIRSGNESEKLAKKENSSNIHDRVFSPQRSRWLWRHRSSRGVNYRSSLQGIHNFLRQRGTS